MLEYKGYTGRVVFDNEADLFHGEVVGIRDMVTFHGRSTAKLRQAFRDSVDDYLEFCQQRGETPNSPPLVHIVLPLPDTLADRIRTQAAAAHMTDEAWITRILEEHLTGARP